VNPIADHIDEIERGDRAIALDKSWSHEVHLVHLIDLGGIQNRVSLFRFHSFVSLPLIYYQAMRFFTIRFIVDTDGIREKPSFSILY